MSSLQNKQSVLVFGATGKTGTEIIDALVDSKNFNVFAAVRPSSQQKPVVESMRSRGVSIILSDLETLPSSTSDFNDLVATLKSFEIVIAMTTPRELELQIPLVDACQMAGVKRFIPCDVGTACPRGVRVMHDKKLTIHDHIEKVGLGHTYVDVGWWFQLSLPVTDPSKIPYPEMIEASYQFFVPSDGVWKRSALTDRRDIGSFFARIIADERTLNKYVFCWSEERTQEEIWDIVARISGQEIKKTEVPEAGVAAYMEQSLAADIKTGKTSMEATHSQYAYSMWIRGDNTIANAKKPEYGNALDARELYPDLKPKSLEEYVKEVHSDTTS